MKITFISLLILMVLRIPTFSQDKTTYIVTISHDTLINRYVVKVNPSDNLIKLTDSEGMLRIDYPLDSVDHFYFKNTRWKLVEKMEDPTEKKKPKMFSKTSNLADLLSKKKEELHYHYVFLPESHEDNTYNLGNWGPALGTKTQTKIKVTSKDKCSLFEYDFVFNSGAVGGVNSMMYLYNDSLGFAKVFYIDKKHYSEEGRNAIKDLLSAYTSDRPDLLAELTNENKYDLAFIFFN